MLSCRNEHSGLFLWLRQPTIMRASYWSTTWPVPLFYWLCQSVWQSETWRPLWISTKSWYRWEGLKVNKKPLLGTIGSYKTRWKHWQIYTNKKRSSTMMCFLSRLILHENILRDLNDIKGCIVGGYNLNNVRYADDAVLIAGSESQLQERLNTVVDASLHRGLSININKTHCMVISKTKITPHVTFTLTMKPSSK